MKKRGFTLIELLVVIAIIAMLLAILMPALSKVKKIAQRVVCGTNLKGLGTAQNVYGHDYNGQFTVQGGRSNPTWTNTFGATAWYNPNLPWNTVNQATLVTLGSSLYLLVREADVSPKSFICPAGGETEFDGRNPNNLDLVQLWDFGNQPWNRVSYSYHLPYQGGAGTPTGQRSQYAADSQRSAAFAVMADRNPYSDTRLNAVGVGTVTQQNYLGLSSLIGEHWNENVVVNRGQILSANAQPHDREGQNVLFADGHTEYTTTSDVGERNDGIYTQWTSATPAPTDQMAWRRGEVASGNMYGSRARSRQDSLLLNDKEEPSRYPHATTTP